MEMSLFLNLATKLLLHDFNEKQTDEKEEHYANIIKKIWILSTV